jgi:integrase
MRKTVWVEPRTKPGTYSVRYYDPETGLAQRIPCESFDEMRTEKTRIQTMLLNSRAGKGNPEAIPSVVFERYIEWLLEHKRRPGTISLKRFAVNPFLNRVRRMGAVDHESIADWKSAMVAKYSNDTVSIRLRELRAFLNWCVAKKYLTNNPMDGSDLAEGISIPSSVFVGRRLTVLELQAMYAHCSDVFRPFFALAVETGARRGELLGITWKEVNLDRGTWTIPAARCKTNRERTIPLSEQALAALRSILPTKYTGDEVFTGWTEFKVKYHWGQTLKAAGIEGRVRLHDIRHTFASNFRGRGSSLKAICGWTTDAMANKYTHTVVEELREDMAKFGVPLGADLGRTEVKGD